MREVVFLLGVLLFPFFLIGQNFTLSGTVKDWEGQPLIGATVILHELNSGTLTNAEGYYEFDDLKTGSYHVHITFVGHESVSRTIIIRDQNITADFLLKPSTVELNEVLVEANPFKSGPVEQSMTIETMDREFLLGNNEDSFVGSMQKLPGITAINTGVGIAKPVIRGMSFNRVVVNDRGVKQEGQQWGADHGLEIDQYEPDRVEIIKGPASLLYGSDAMGGVINIRPAPIPKEGTLKGDVLAVYKSNNNLYATSTAIEGNSRGKFLNLRISTQDFADYRVPADSFWYNRRKVDIADSRLENTAGKERDITATVGIAKNWGYSKLTVSNFYQRTGFFPGAIGVPGEYEPASNNNYRDVDIPRQRVNHLKIISNTSVLLGKNWLELDLGFQSNRRREEGEPHAHGYQDTPDGFLALGLNLDTYSASLKYHLQGNENYKAIHGLQYQHQRNDFRGFEFLLPAFTATNIGVYSYHELTVNNKATINGGLRAGYGNRDIKAHSGSDYTTEDPNDTIVYSTKIQRDFVNLSAAMGFSYYPHHNFNAKLNLGTSYRFPTAPELSMNGIHHGTFRHEKGRSDLDSERGYQIEVNLTYHTKDLHVAITPFFSYYDQFIYLKPAGIFSNLPAGGQVYQYQQNNAVFTGGEVSTEYHFIDNLHLRMAAEYVWNYNLDSKWPLPFTPPFSLLGELRYEVPLKSDRFSDLYAGFDAQYFAAQKRVDQNEKTTPGYSLFSINSGIKFLLGQQKADLKFSVQNLLNKSYLNHLSRYRLLSLPEQGRNFVVSVKIPISLITKN